MTTITNDFHRADVRDANLAQRTSFRVAILGSLLAVCAALPGCDSLKNHECCLFKPGGIFAQNAEEVERLPSREENEAVTRAASASYQKKEAWEPTESELSYARRNNVDLKSYVWSAQKPNGGVLFPRSLPAPGPIVLMEPSTITAPVGTDIILVASYVGEDSEHLRVGEKLAWNLSGVGSFTSTNPRNSSTCLQCPWSATSRDVEGRSETTETSGQLYRITRGTKSQEDDITILRGQSWMAVSSNEEGTSSVTVQSGTVPNWERRRANATIHWIDAAFLFPKSAVGPVDRPGKLETSIVRRSDSIALPGWKVRYEVISGEGGFSQGGDNPMRSVDLVTGADGKAQVDISQLNNRPGTSEIKVSVLRPGTTEYKEVVVDSRTIFYTWTNSAPLGIQVVAPDFAAANTDVHYKIYINNFSEFYYDSQISIKIPQGAKFVSISPTYPNVAPNPTELRWRLVNLMPHEFYPIDLTLRKLHSGNIDLDVKLFDSHAVGSPTYPNGGSNVEPPPTSPPPQR